MDSVSKDKSRSSFTHMNLRHNFRMKLGIDRSACRSLLFQHIKSLPIELSTSEIGEKMALSAENYRFD